MGRLIVVSNRVPAARERNQLAGGLAIGLKQALSDQDAVWFGWSGGTAHGEGRREVKRETVGRVTFMTIDLSGAEHRGFYQGFANGILWPLLHYRVGLMEYKRAEREAYDAVNDAFADSLLPEIAPDDTVWIHDYHLIPLGRALRARGVANRIGFFLHIPFPPRALFAALPGGTDFLRAFEAYDVLGVQTAQDRDQLNDAMEAAGHPRAPAAVPHGVDTRAVARPARPPAPRPPPAPRGGRPRSGSSPARSRARRAAPRRNPTPAACATVLPDARCCSASTGSTTRRASPSGSGATPNCSSASPPIATT